MTARDVKLVRVARPTVEGAGVHLRRAFGFGSDPELFDPFLMMDDFRGDELSQYIKGFPWHPHRGIETITYMIEGECDHGDSMGNSGTIAAGDVQWMTAGSGIIHQEMPRGNEQGRMGGFQLWANLPAAQKMRDPRYLGLVAEQIPVADVGGAQVRVIAGSVDETSGPVAEVTVDPEYFDVTLDPGASWTHAVPADHTVFIFLFEGAGRFGGDAAAVSAGTGTVLLFGEGDEVVVSAGSGGARFILVSGRPLHEPVAWRGPIVMNTREQLDLAWRELDEGTFIKHPPAGR
jgi:redox-sensitive bicupin YhaK (pirin superfamily)